MTVRHVHPSSNDLFSCELYWFFLRG